MALNPTALGLALANVSNPLGPSANEIQHWTDMATVIIQHFQQNAVINTDDLVDVTIPPQGVATIISAAPGSPCTGSGTGSGKGKGVGTIS